MSLVNENLRGPDVRMVCDTREFICGWGAAFINIAVTYPINKIMFRQMLHGVDSQMAVREIKHEGIRFLYRGILPPLVQKSCSAALMFGMYDQCQQLLQRLRPDSPRLVVVSASSLLAGTAEAILTPLERVQTLLQDKKYNIRFHNTLHALLQLRSYGLREYYRGVTPILVRNGPSNVIFFGLRGEVKQRLPQARTNAEEIINDFISGACVGAFISTVFYPINLAKTKMQSKVGGQFYSIRITLARIYQERGRKWNRIFVGVHVNCTRAILSWGIINATYEIIKKIIFIDHDK